MRRQTPLAIKKGQTSVRLPDSFETMGAVRCENCGEEFAIGHDPAFTSLVAAERQAHWLERVLADDHDGERPHPDRIVLPE